MNISDIVLILVAVGITAGALVVQLYKVPRGRDRLVEELLEMLHEPDAAPEATLASVPLGDLAESLFRHFAQSGLSRQIVESLASHDAGIDEAKVAETLNARVIEDGYWALPTSAIRKVVTILMGSGFVALRKGQLRLTESGQQLHRLLQDHCPVMMRKRHSA